MGDDRVTTDDVGDLPTGYRWVRPWTRQWGSGPSGKVVHVQDLAADDGVICPTVAYESGWKAVDPDVHPEPLTICKRCTTSGVIRHCLGNTQGGLA